MNPEDDVKPGDARPVVRTHCVFVIEEDEVTRAALQFMLPGGNETYEMADIASVLPLGRQRPPDLILVGESVIVRNTRALLHQLRAVWPDLKCLVICESGDDECQAAARAVGADDTLTRPFKPEVVRRKVDGLLGSLVPWTGAVQA